MRLRPATPADLDFERALYASTRAAELDAWGWPAAQREAFLDLQFRAQQASFAGRTVRIAEVDGHPAGRLVTDTDSDTVHLVDIAVLPAFQGAGLGTALLRQLQDEAPRIHLEARRDDPRLLDWYTTRGFRIDGRDTLHAHLSWAAGPDRRGVLTGAVAGAAALTLAPATASAARPGDTFLEVTPLSTAGVADAELRVRTPAGLWFTVWSKSAGGVSAGNRVRVPFEGAPELEIHADGRVWSVRVRHAESDVALDARWPLVRRSAQGTPERPTLRIRRG